VSALPFDKDHSITFPVATVPRHARRAMHIGTLSIALFSALLSFPLTTVRAQDQNTLEIAPELSDSQTRIIEHVQRDDLTEAEVKLWIDFANEIKTHAKQDLTVWERAERILSNPWVFFGFAAQGVFMMRFVVQLIASERKKRSYVPIAFWYLSLAGGLMLLTYALVRRDPVFVLGQGLGIIIYARNLMLIRQRNGKLMDRLDKREQRQLKTTALEPGAETP